MAKKQIHTFLGANSENGFYSLYGSLIRNDRAFIIKGGPGSGKSSLMKKIGIKALEEGYFTEFCHCSSDAESLDGVRIPEMGLCVVDGTPPHATEPRYPGAKDDLINTGAFWNAEKLRNHLEEIKETSRKISEQFAHAYRYLAAAGKVAEDIRDSVLQTTDTEKIRRFAVSLVQKHVKPMQAEGTVFPRFLSAITPQGYITHGETIYTLCEKVFVLEDFCRTGEEFLNTAVSAATERGHTVYAFYDPLSPSRLCHVAIPTAETAFVTSDRMLRFEARNAYCVHLDRFSSPDENARLRCKNGERFIRLCIDEAVRTLKEEKSLHDELEAYYGSAMDFKKLNAYTQRLLRNLFSSEK